VILSVLLLGAAQASATAVPVSTTSLGKPVQISAPRAGRLVAVLSDVTVGAPVDGDVIVWGGDVTFTPGGSIQGNLSVFGGSIRGAGPGPIPVSGSVSTPGSLLAYYLAEMRRPPWESPPRASVFLGLRLIALSAWLAGSLALLWLFGSTFARAAESADRAWSRALVAGACGVSALFLAAAAALALLPLEISVPVVFLFGGFAVAAKIFGMAALFLLLGQKIRKTLAASARPGALAAGFAALGAISLVPVVGPVLWSAASVISVGIALSSRFGAAPYRIHLA
jgi:hypothetical protein